MVPMGWRKHIAGKRNALIEAAKIASYAAASPKLDDKTRAEYLATAQGCRALADADGDILC